MLAHRLRRWANINPTLAQWIVFAENAALKPLRAKISYHIWIFTHLKLCLARGLATATHNFKWVIITNICFILNQRPANLDAQTLIPILSDLIG